jgi:hypothetical protein
MITEKELLQRFADGIRQAEECARALAHMRRQESWVRIVGFLETVRTKAKILAALRGVA